MDVKINNPEQIPEQIVRAAIAMMEQEEGRTVQEISIRRTGKLLRAFVFIKQFILGLHDLITDLIA